MEYLYSKLKTLERQSSPMTRQERLAAMTGPLLDWYHKNRRTLPWREEPLPYRVWISEIMLQQTRVEAVKPYFARFMEKLPDVQTLADAEEEVLLKLWEGLGYYNRARNLKKAAQVMVAEYGGKLPASFEALLKLPGIGSYTAGAIASIAYQLPAPAVDGNVLRVISRILADREEIDKPSVKKSMETAISEVMDKEEPGNYNQALIELGALICIPAGKPLCGECPLKTLCLSRREGLTDEIPVRREKKKRKIEEKTIFIIEWEDQAVIRKRADKGLLASLYELPNVEGHIKEEEISSALCLNKKDVALIERLSDSIHIFSHIEWHMIGYRVKLNNNQTNLFEMVKKEEIFSKYPLPNAFAVYTKVLK